METKNFSTWDEFEEYALKKTDEANTKTSKDFYRPIFRGQANADWSLKTTLDRVRERYDAFDYIEIIFSIKNKLETFTQQKWDGLNDPNKIFDDFHPDEYLGNPKSYPYMLYLRHHGFPSPLLDWSLSPYIAAYFAFREGTKCKEVAIYTLCRMPAETDVPSRYRIHVTEHNVTTTPRHVLQQAIYTYCFDHGAPHEAPMGVFYDDHEKDTTNTYEIKKCILPYSEREKVLTKLDRMNINAFSLFNSEEGLCEMLSIDSFVLQKFTI